MKRMTVLLAAMLLLILSACAAAENLKVEFFDVGKADAMLITTPAGERVLIDAATNKQGKKLVERFRKSGIGSIDAMIITHYDKDHVGGADQVLEKMKVGTVIMPVYDKESKQHTQFVEALAKHPPQETMELSTGQETVYTLKSGLELHITAAHESYYGSDEENDFSLAVRNHRGVQRRKAAKKKAKPVKTEEKPIVPAQELESEKAEADASVTPAKDAMKQTEGEENRRRRPAVQVSADKTLRVAPVDERPEFVAQGKVDDSQTRIFGKLPTVQEIERAVKEAEAKKKPEPAAAVQTDAVKADPAVQGDTVRFDREAVSEVNRREEAAKAAKGKKRNEIKPMKKKKGGLFGKKKAEEDDLIDADEDFDDGEDDFIE